MSSVNKVVLGRFRGEIVMLGDGPNSGDGGARNQEGEPAYGSHRGGEAPAAAASPPPDALDDDIPF